MAAVTTFVTLEIEIEVEGCYDPGAPAITSGNPDHWHPEEPVVVEIDKIVVWGRSDVPISLKQLESMIPGCTETIENELVKQAENDNYGAAMDAAVSRYQSRQE